MNNLKIKQITNKQEWGEFFLKQPYTLFVQSWNYGEFYKTMGEKFWIYGIYDNDELIAGSLLLTTHAKRGNFLYIPYGPVWKTYNHDLIPLAADFIKQFAKENKLDFVRVSPFMDEVEECGDLCKKHGFRHAPIHILAETTWLLNLQNKSEADLLADMKKNHRNLISRCQKQGAKIEIFNEVEKLADFNKLHDETARRHNFHRFSDDYVKKEFQAFAQNNQALIFNAYLPDGRLDSSAVVMYYGNMACYRHGASLGLDKKLPTSYLLQWEAIKEARKREMKWYNFWGIAPDNAPKHHPFKGITHFKKGFGGTQKDLVPCHDLPITWRYWLNWGIETIRRKKRGF